VGELIVELMNALFGVLVYLLTMLVVPSVLLKGCTREM